VNYSRSIQLVAVFIIALVASGATGYFLIRPSTTVVKTETENCAVADYSNSFEETIPLEYGLATSDLWNTKNATGDLEQCYGPAGLTTIISISQVTLANSVEYVAGYPEVAFGHNYMGQEFWHSDQAHIQFPMQLSSIDNDRLWLNMTYSISASQPGEMDFSYDLWIKNSTQIGAPTIRDFEIMIEPVDTYSYTSVPIAEMNNQSIVVDGLKQSPSWNVYRLPNGGTNASLTIFALSQASQSLSESISIQPWNFISFLNSSLGYRIPKTYWLMGVEAGSEFYPLPFSTQPTWNWNISRLSISAASSQCVVVP
jgi:hypothetical protein